jgi:CheY-like chemotaxis protein
MDAQGQIILSVKLLADEVTFSVKDTGIGFEPAVLPGLFEMFSQVDSAIDRSEGGLGIGLALVKGLVALHDGTIDGFSAGPGMGSEFTIHLPRSVVVASVPRPQPAITERRDPPVAETRLRVLVADDNRDAADTLALLLEMNGHDVVVAHSGLEALRLGSEAPPHAMILDIGMPDITGYEVARRIRQETWGGGIFLVAVTGWGQSDDKARATAAGFDQHLTKPVDPDQIEKLLQAFFKAPA